MTPELTARVPRLEQYFEEPRLADRPRQTDLLGFVSPERFPELFEEF